MVLSQEFRRKQGGSMQTQAKVVEFARLCCARNDPEKFEKGLYIRIRVGPSKRSAMNQASGIEVGDDPVHLARELNKRIPSLCAEDPGWVECIPHGEKQPIESLPVPRSNTLVRAEDIDVTAEFDALKVAVITVRDLAFSYARLAEMLLGENRALMTDAIDLHRDQAMMETDMVHQLEKSESEENMALLEKLEPVIEGAGKFLENYGRTKEEAAASK